ncbi:MAG: hypothetical protein Q8M76_13675 [Spirochaetaceae bacterium]|nr:hypothetical protein [Spirochaetaceae bacterium]
MKPRPAAILLIASLGALSLQAQSNKVIDEMLAQPQATYAHSAYMALVGGSWIDESATPDEAFALAQQKNWIPGNAVPTDPIELGRFSVLAMRGLRIKGGVGWTLFHSKRYAVRELIARGVANASGGQNRIPSGEEAIRMIGKMSSLTGAPK